MWSKYENSLESKVKYRAHKNDNMHSFSKEMEGGTSHLENVAGIFRLKMRAYCDEDFK